MHEYNSQKEPITLKEYGRNIQRIAELVAATEDKAEKSKMANTLVELMKQINPNGKDNQDFDQTVWNNLYHVIGDTELADAPYPRPVLKQDTAPEKLQYSTEKIKYLHYGKNIQNLIIKASEIKDPEEQEVAIMNLGRMMFRFFATWNRENVDPEIIKRHLSQLSDGKLVLDIEKGKEHNIFFIPKELLKSNNSREQSRGNNKTRQNRKRRR